MLDHPGASPIEFVAGIGSRSTPPPYLKVIRTLAADIARRGYGLRSGAALGADQAWEEGARSAGGVVESFVPTKRGGATIPLSSLPPDLVDQAMTLATGLHPAWHRLDDYARKLMCRNAFQVLGRDLASPVTLVLCWATGSKFDAAGAICNVSGGTGLAVRLAHSRGIPVLNLAVPTHLDCARRWHHAPSERAEHLVDLLRASVLSSEPKPTP